MNLFHHLGSIGWAGATKIPPMLYGISLLFILVPTLPVEEHGIYASVFALFTFITIFNKYLVLHPMIRYAAIPGKFERTARTGFYLTLIVYAFAALLIVSTAPLIAKSLRVSTYYVYFTPLLLAGILFREYGFCIQQSIYRIKLIFYIESVYWIGSAAGFALLASLGKLTTAGDALKVHLLAGAGSSLLAIIFGFNKARLIGKVFIEDIIELLKYGYYTIGIGLSTFLINGNVDILLIGAVYNPVQVAYYNTAKRAYQMISSISQAIAMVVMPYSSKLSAQKMIGELRGLFEKSVGYITALLTAIVVAGYILAGVAFSFVFEGKYDASTPMFRIMLLGAPFEAIYIITGNILYGSGAAATVAVISIKALVLWIAVSAPGIYFLAGSGAAAGLAVTMIFMGVMVYRKAIIEIDTNTRNIAARVINNLSTVIHKYRG